jgi:hypothetical protein
MREEVVLARTDQRDGLTRVIVEYVSLTCLIIIRLVNSTSVDNLVYKPDFIDSKDLNQVLLASIM